MSGQYVRAMLKRLADKAGIEKRVHPHALRHSHAFEMVRDGIPVTTIQKQLGHVSLITTQVYLDHVAPMAVVEAIRNRPAWNPEPVDGMKP